MTVATIVPQQTSIEHTARLVCFEACLAKGISTATLSLAFGLQATTEMLDHFATEPSAIHRESARRKFLEIRFVREATQQVEEEERLADIREAWRSAGSPSRCIHCPVPRGETCDGCSVDRPPEADEHPSKGDTEHGR